MPDFKTLQRKQNKLYKQLDKDLECLYNKAPLKNKLIIRNIQYIINDLLNTERELTNLINK